MTKTQSSHKELIPQRIRYMREDANMSYEELSNKTGISIGNLKKMETPEYGKLPAVDLAMLTEVFPISVDALFSDMSFDNFKETYQHLKVFSTLSEDLQNAFLETMHEVPLCEHTDEEFVEALFRKVTDGDDEAYQNTLKISIRTFTSNNTFF